MDAFIGTVLPFAGRYAPAGWELCQGQLLPIAAYSSLFQVIGTDFGGDGVQTFALPDLQGRFPIGAGSGPGLTPRGRGAQGGVEAVTLMASQMPRHSHRQVVSADAGTTGTASETALPAAFTGTVESPTEGPLPIQSQTYNPGTHPVKLKADSIQDAGGSEAHQNMPPFLVLNFIICTFGIFPSEKPDKPRPVDA